MKTEIALVSFVRKVTVPVDSGKPSEELGEDNAQTKANKQPTVGNPVVTFLVESKEKLCSEPKQQGSCSSHEKYPAFAMQTLNFFIMATVHPDVGIEAAVLEARDLQSESGTQADRVVPKFIPKKGARLSRPSQTKTGSYMPLQLATK
jgi:hypothetical protein